jgi:hypothetical protein
MYLTGGFEHRQEFQSFLAGDKKVYVECEDIAGNIANRTTDFVVEIDTSSPIVTRIYNNYGSLTVVTHEKAECGFVNQVSSRRSRRCSFDFSNVTMMIGNDKLHTTPFESGKTYYIKCEDQFGNVNDGCAAIVEEGFA